MRRYGRTAEGGEARFEPGRRDRAEPLARPIRSIWECMTVSPAVILAAVLLGIVIWLTVAVVNVPRPPLSHHH